MKSNLPAPEESMIPLEEIFNLPPLGGFSFLGSPNESPEPDQSSDMTQTLEDSATLHKRQRNTESARRSRLRRLLRLQELESKIAHLEQERSHWNLQLHMRDAQLKLLKQREEELVKRIVSLEMALKK